jgi:hypothetical protein
MVTTNGIDLSAIEFRMRKGIEEHARARSRGDLYENVFRLHTPLEDALDAHLGEEAEDLAFSQKVGRCLPELYASYGVEELAKQRNYLGHPKQPLSDEYVRNTAFGLAELAAAAWPKLFGHPGPVVTHPDLSRSAESEPAPPPQPYYTAYDQPPEPEPPLSRRLPCLYFILGFVLMACIGVGAFAFAKWLATTEPQPTPSPIVIQPGRGPAGEIAVGSRVQVAVPEGRTLKARTEPGSDQPEQAAFTNGTQLTVVDGPRVTPDGVTWWKVERERGTNGWSAAGWLRPAE